MDGRVVAVKLINEIEEKKGVSMDASPPYSSHVYKCKCLDELCIPVGPCDTAGTTLPRPGRLGIENTPR